MTKRKTPGDAQVSVYLAPGRVAALPLQGLDEAKLVAFRVRLAGRPDWWRTAATNVTHAAYRYLWAHPPEGCPVGELFTLEVQRVTAEGLGDAYSVDVEVHPVVLSSVRLPRTTTEA